MGKEENCMKIDPAAFDVAEPLPESARATGGVWYLLRVQPRSPSTGMCQPRRMVDRAKPARLSNVSNVAGAVDVTTPLRGEFVVEAVLRRRGFEAWVPVESFFIRRNRYSKGKKRLMFHPILIGYVLVRLEGKPNWPRVLDYPMITGVVGVGGAPLRVREQGLEELLAIQRREQARPDERLMPTHRTYDVGDEVEVLDGALDGARLKVVGLTRQAAAFESLLFGGARGTIPLHKIGKIG